MGMAEEMERRKPSQKEVLDGGRILGVISRTDPEVYAVIKEISEREGENPVQVMINIIKRYMMVQKIEQSKLSLEQILAAFELFKDIARESIKMYVDLAGLVFSDLTTSFGQIIEKKAEQLSRSDSTDREIRRMMTQKLLQAYEPILQMMSVMMSNMMANMFKMQGINVNMPQMQTSDKGKKDIPVNININP
jgi:oligoendopeptidase F